MQMCCWKRLNIRNIKTQHLKFVAARFAVCSMLSRRISKEFIREDDDDDDDGHGHDDDHGDDDDENDKGDDNDDNNDNDDPNDDDDDENKNDDDGNPLSHFAPCFPISKLLICFVVLTIYC